MALYARMQNGTLSAHRFSAAITESATGAPGVTRQNIIDRFQLAADDIVQLDQMIATYTALGSGNVSQVMAKSQWLHRMANVFLLIESNDYTEAQAKARLGIT